MYRAISVDVAAASCAFIYHPFIPVLPLALLYILLPTFAHIYANDLMIKINTSSHHFAILFQVFPNDFIEFLLIL